MPDARYVFWGSERAWLDCRLNSNICICRTFVGYTYYYVVLIIVITIAKILNYPIKKNFAKVVFDNILELKILNYVPLHTGELI